MSPAAATAAADVQTERPPAIPATEIPRVRLPRTVQTLRFIARPVSFFERCRTELGETFQVSLFGPGRLTFVSDPESLKRLFAADRMNTIAPGRNVVLRPLLGAGSLLLQEGEEHLVRRRLMLPPFHGERMRAYERTIVDATERAIASWPRGSEFALHPSMQAITLEVILRAVFGVEDETRREALRTNLVEILAESASPAALGLAFPLTRRLPHYRSFARVVERTDALLAEQIAERRADPEIRDREDILSMLVAAEFEDGSRMSDAELRDQLMTLLLAGHETTATGLAWTFDLLLHRPDALQRLIDEIDSGEREYLEAVIEESLRLRPVVPFTGRELRADAELAGYAMPAGTIVMAGIYLTHTRPDVYPQPHAFLPERFLGEDRPESFAWIPFGGGTRRCIGAAFAQFEMRVAVETILRAVTLRAASPDPERPVRRNVTLSPRDGTRVVAADRV
jgi:cytochrome P450